MTKLFFKLVLANLIFATNIHLQAQEQDRCRDVLLYQTCDVLKISYNSSASKAFRDFVTSSNFNSDISKFSASGDISLPIDGIPIKLGASGSDQKISTWRSEFLRNQSLNVTEEQAFDFFRQIAPKNAIDAWKSCMSRASSIKVEHIVSGENIILTAKFQITNEASRNSHPTVVSLITTNCTQINENNFKAGTEITLYGTVAQLQRIDKHKETMITLVTTEGISETIKLVAEPYRTEVGYIRASWEEPYEAESSPREVFQELLTDNNNGNGEQNRKRYNITMDRSYLGKGYLRNIKLDCVEGTISNGCNSCHGWNEKIRAELISSKVAQGIFDTWSYPSRWRLSGEWIGYEIHYKRGGTGKKILKCGSELILAIPKNAINVHIEGESDQGEFDYTINKISSTKFVKYNGFTDSYGYYNLSFKILNETD